MPHKPLFAGVGQDTFTEELRAGLAGMLHGRGHQIEPLFVEGADIPFGAGVVAGTEEQDASLPSGAFTVADFRGVVRRNPNIERLYKSTENPVHSVEFDPVMDVVRLRNIIVIPSVVVARDEAVWLHHTDGGGLLIPGSFSNVVDGGNNVDVSTVASWFRGNSVIGAPAVLQLHIN